jgi:hypothetical protein
MSAFARCYYPLTFALLLTASLRHARADDATEDPSRARARALGYGGLEAFRQGDYGTASAQLDEGFQLLRVPSLGLWSARALAKLGKLVEADARYAETESLSVTAADPPVQLASREEAVRERKALAPRIPTLRVLVNGVPPENVVLTLDGTPLEGPGDAPHPLNPGDHRVTGTIGAERREIRVTLREDTHEAVTLYFAALPAPILAPAVPLHPGDTRADRSVDEGARPFWRGAAWAAAGVGTAGVVFGAVTYVIGRVRYEEFSRDGVCRGEPTCDAQEEVASYDTLRTLSAIGLIGGGALLGAGVTTLLLVPAAPEGSTSALPTGIALMGRF